MEKIIINSIEEKSGKTGKFWVVKYDGKDGNNLNATIGSWHSKVADFIMDNVGAGGHCIVKIVKKGLYTNIEEVDKNVFGKGIPQTETQKTQDVQQTGSNLMSQKSISIVSQVCLKGAVELAKEHKFDDNEKLGEYLCMVVGELANAYKVAVKSLSTSDEQ